MRILIALALVTLIYAIIYGIEVLVLEQRSKAEANPAASTSDTTSVVEALGLTAELGPSIFVILLIIAGIVLLCIYGYRFVAYCCAHAPLLWRRPG